MRHVMPAMPNNRASEVSFKVSRPGGNYGLHKITETVFKLGLGPCGRHVLSLSAVVCEDFLRVTQHSRMPDDLEPPASPTEAYRSIAEHECASRWFRPVLLTIKPEPEVYYTGFLWWRKKHIRKADEPKPEARHGFLTPEELETHKATVRAYEKAVHEWENRKEIKEFIYKITDIHGRITITK
ncbi:hypothetical protein YZUPF006_000009 [Pseudomonas phage YZU-PF-006]